MTFKEQLHQKALSIECAYCNAKAGDKCRYTNLTQGPTLGDQRPLEMQHVMHKARYQAAEKLLSGESK